MFAATTVAALLWPMSADEPLKIEPFVVEATIQSMPRWSPAGDQSDRRTRLIDRWLD